MDPEGSRSPAPGLWPLLLLSLSLVDPASGGAEDGDAHLALPEVAAQRFLLRRPHPAYRNYAIHTYTQYPNHQEPYGDAPRIYYGPLGHRLIKGYYFYNWREWRLPGLSCEDDNSRQCGSAIESIGGQVVARDGYGGWGYSAIVGSAGTLFLTPLTMALARTSGLRLDVSTPHLKSTSHARRTGHHLGNSSMMLAQRFQADLGALSLGLNWANSHAYRSDRAGNSLKGRLRSDRRMASWLLVKIEDDSPDDGRGGSTVQGLELIVNGERRPDLRPFAIRHRSGALTQVGQISQAEGVFRPKHYTRGRNIPLYADYLYRIDHELGVDVSANTNLPGLLNRFALADPGAVLQAGRDEELIFLFDLSREPDIVSVEVEALVANDCRVSWSTLREIRPGARTYLQRFEAGHYRAVFRARGNVGDGSNFRRVRFEVGEWTAHFVYSADLNLVLPGLEIHGEYARSSIYRRYPAHLDHRPAFDLSPRFADRGPAWFVNAVHRFSGGRLGGELFSVDHHYSGLVQDNDDGDSKPDSGDLDGVYLGGDEDNDGFADTNRNDNRLPDYLEPFLMYDVEPNEYVYGLDRNNNDEPDAREDDWDPDYPYDRDQRGFHIFAQIDLTRHWSLGAGRYHVEEIAGPGRNKSSYALLTFRREDGGGKLFLESHWRRVQDDIPDPYTVVDRERRFEDVYRRSSVHTGSYWGVHTLLPKLTRDPLFYKDSYVGETYLEARLRLWSGLNLVQKARLRLNWQQGGLSEAGYPARRRRLDHWTAVSRVDWTWRRGRLSLEPRFKLLFMRFVDQRTGRFMRREYDVIPILLLNYELMSRTVLRLGLEGWGPLPYRYKDRARRLESYERRTFIATLTNPSRYFGYDLYTIVGFDRDSIAFDAPSRRDEDFHVWTFFVRTLIGFTEYGGLL